MNGRAYTTSIVACLVTTVGLIGQESRSRTQRQHRAGQTHSAPSTGSHCQPHTNHAARFPLEFRSIDGRDNNTGHPEWGAAEIPFVRMVPAAYADGVSAPSGTTRPSARAISNAVAAQAVSMPNARDASDFVWQWGQFLDHDLDETPGADPEEAFDILVPLGDPWFDPQGLGNMTIPLNRSGFEVVDGVREQVNLITAWIDGSNVYGSDDARAVALRTMDGTGFLRTSTGDLLPFNAQGLPNVPSSAPNLFLAGDVRANEQVGLLAMHTLFVREHNYWALWVGAVMPALTGEQRYQVARAIVVAELQAITYNEFLPVLLGKDALPRYRGYRPSVNPGIANEFATAAYRVGHTMLSSQLLRLDASGAEHAAGHLSLAEAFFRPDEISSWGIDPILRGLAAQRAQAVDPFVIDDVRNFLFGQPGSGGFDLASLNIQRGRDHGLATYNQIRAAVGRAPAHDFDDITEDASIRSRLASVYGCPDEVDAWVGLLAEAPVDGALVGRTLRRVLADQFRRLRDGDRFWYRSYLPADAVQFVDRQRLSTIIRRNTDIAGELPDDVFHVPE